MHSMGLCLFPHVYTSTHSPDFQFANNLYCQFLSFANLMSKKWDLTGSSITTPYFLIKLEKISCLQTICASSFGNHFCVCWAFCQALFHIQKKFLPVCDLVYVSCKYEDIILKCQLLDFNAGEIISLFLDGLKFFCPI